VRLLVQWLLVSALVLSCLWLGVDGLKDQKHEAMLEWLCELQCSALPLECLVFGLCLRLRRVVYDRLICQSCAIEQGALYNENKLPAMSGVPTCGAQRHEIDRYLLIGSQGLRESRDAKRQVACMSRCCLVAWLNIAVVRHQLGQWP
jgi:hypothetical protein